jgi:hypothetical protein
VHLRQFWRLSQSSEEHSQSRRKTQITKSRLGVRAVHQFRKNQGGMYNTGQASGQFRSVPPPQRRRFDNGAGVNTKCNEKGVAHGRDMSRNSTTCGVKSRKTGDCEGAIWGHGADVNCLDNFEPTPLHITSRHPSDDLARLLLDHGAKPNRRSG